MTLPMLPPTTVFFPICTDSAMGESTHWVNEGTNSEIEIRCAWKKMSHVHRVRQIEIRRLVLGFDKRGVGVFFFSGPKKLYCVCQKKRAYIHEKRGRAWHTNHTALAGRTV